MQTFLPYRSFEKSARCLDRLRLGKQRVEVLQILKTLNTLPEERNGWRNHPAVQMWDGYTECLIEYGIAVCDEWIRRGYRDTCRNKILAYSWGLEVVEPYWLGNLSFHRSHQSNLKRKNCDHYGPLFPRVPDDLEYIWPLPVN